MINLAKKIIVAVSVSVLPLFAMADSGWGCTGTDGSPGSAVYKLCMHYCSNKYLNQFQQCQSNKINNVTLFATNPTYSIPSCVAYDSTQGYDVTVSYDGCPCIKGKDQPCH